MEKFTKSIRKKSKDKIEEPIIFENEWMKITNFEDNIIIEQSATVVCIPYIIEYNQFIVRHEYIPAFKKLEGDDYYLTCVAGSVEVGETNEQALKRELEEEAGIVLRDGYQFEFERPLFSSKASTAQFHYCIVPLTENDYHEISTPTGDGSYNESISKSVKVDVKYINHVKPSDLITELLISRLKKYLTGQQ